MNALSNKKVRYVELVFTNAVIIMGLWLLEKRLMLPQECSIRLIYEKIEHIHTKDTELMLADLKERTGINVTRFEIQKINFLKDIADIMIYFRDQPDASMAINQIKIK